MKRLLILCLAGVGFLSSCRTTNVYLEDRPTRTRTTYTPSKVVGGSSTYTSDSPEDFRAVGPSN